MIQTGWTNIRVCLYKRDDGRFEFFEEGTPIDEKHDGWKIRLSRLHEDFETAKAGMIDYYCNQVEDEYTVDPESVTILYPPDFKGPYHPVFRADRGDGKAGWRLREMTLLATGEAMRTALYRSPDNEQLWVQKRWEDGGSYLHPVTTEDAIRQFPNAAIAT